MMNARKTSQGKGSQPSALQFTASTFREAPQAGFTPAEREALLAVGVDPDHEISGQAAVDATARHAKILETALSVALAARKLGVDPRRLRQRIHERSLIAVKGSNGRWLVPGFQFTAANELPGLRSVASVIRPDAPVTAIISFFTSPQADLEGKDGEATTPIAWLAFGRDPETVRSLATAI